jgi:acetyl-CoA carboxylase carboxyltransferase component
VFPGQYGAARIFYYNSLMRRYLRVPQLAAVMGQCVAGGAYLPALSDVILMVKGSSFMGLGGPNLVKGATGQTIDGETLGGAVTHTEVSGVAHYALDTDDDCLRKLRDLVDRLPRKAGIERVAPAEPAPGADGDGAAPHALYSLLPSDHRMPYDMHAVLRTFLDDGRIDEFQQNLAREMICGDARVGGMAVGWIANQRGLIKGRPGERARFGGIVYAESAEKVAFFIDRCDRQGIPLLFVQDVSASWWAPTPSTRGSSARARASWRRWPPRAVAKIVLTVNHASGAGYYAMAARASTPTSSSPGPAGGWR